MEMVREYLYVRYTEKMEPLPFPNYLLPENRYKNDFWITQEGECIYPWEMENRHLLNTIRLLHRNRPTLEGVYLKVKGDDHVLYGKALWAEKKSKNQNENLSMTYYFALWENYRIYMLLRREIKIRGLEEYL